MIRFRHCGVLSSNLKRSIAFYEQLGLKVVKQEKLKGLWVDALFSVRNANITYVKMQFESECNRAPMFELHYWQNPKIRREGFHHVSFTVDNIYETYNKLEKKNVDFLSPPLVDEFGINTLCFCIDPDKNLIELVEEPKCL